MKAVLTVVLLSLMVGPPAPAQAQTPDLDLLTLLTAQPGTAERLGLFKLTASERVAWNELLNVVLRSSNGAPGYPGLQTPRPGFPVARLPVSVFEGVIDDFAEDLVELSNGAVVELVGSNGFARYRQEALLIGDDFQWRLWIEEVGTFAVRPVRQPSVGGRRGEPVTIGEVLEYGEIIRLTDGRVLQVEPRDTFYSEGWRPLAEAILIEGYELLDLDRGERVGIRGVR